MFNTSETVDLAEWIIDNTCLVNNYYAWLSMRKFAILHMQ